MAQGDCTAGSSRLTIDLGAIRANHARVAAAVAPAICGAVVKADAYGLGAARVAPMLHAAGCRTFFVAQLQEAVALHEAIGVGSDIFILNGADPGSEACCADRGFLPVLNSASQVERWRALARARGERLPAALQVDSGMSRLGLDPQAVEALAADPAFAAEVELRLLMTHLACADDPADPANAMQRERFEAARALFPGVPASIANSGGAFLPGFHGDVARPGIALYGAAPNALADGLRAVAALEVRIIQIREIAAGTGVGYGLDYVAPGPRRIATLAIGYADGWPRHLSGTGAAWHEGHRLPILGRVSMDGRLDVIASPLGDGDFALQPSPAVMELLGLAP